MIKLPRVIGSEVRLHPISLSITENIIPLSSATMTVLGNEILPVRTYVELFTANGSAGIYRTRLPQDVKGSDNAIMQLDHAVSEVGDWVVQDAINAEKTVRQAFETIFAHYRGTDWQLGTFTATETVTVDCDYDNVLEQLLSVLEQQPKYMMTFDFSTAPWTLSIAEKTNVVDAEGRLSRNISSATIKRDDKDLCTRVYVKGLPKPSGRESDENAIGYMDADTIETYGVVEKETGGTNLTAEQAQRVAEAYLAAHKHPKLSVEIEAYDLYSITGENLDSLALGKLYRLVLPDDDTTITDYITRIIWQDVYGEPNRANIVIGDMQDAVLNFFQDQSSANKSSKRSSKKQAKENDSFEKKFEITDEYGAILEQAGMRLDAHGLIVYARDNVNNIGSIFDMTSSQLRSEIQAGDEGLSSQILQTASAIMLSVDNSISGVQAQIIATADSVRSEVGSSNSRIYSYVNQTATNIVSMLADTENGLYNYTNSTASGLHQVLVDTTNQVWIQDTDPTTEAGGGHIPKTGDVWVESTHQGSWDGAEGFDWEHDEDYDWFDVQGAKIWGWANGKWELVSDQQQTISWSEMINTVDLYVQQRVKQMVNDEGNIDIYISMLAQTAESIRAEVSTAGSTIYSYIHMTATNINMRVADTPRTVISKTQPTTINGRGLKEGDVWVESEFQKDWDAAYDLSWDDDREIDWNKLRSDNIHVYHDGEWKEVVDGETLIDDADIDVEHNIVRLYARKLERVDGELQRYYGELKVGAKEITAKVNEYYNQLGSSISQTARQIRSEVHAGNSNLYSYIEQTATYIRSVVADVENGLSSSITQTASQIRAEVNAGDSTLYSYIDQTASQIRTQVANSVSNLQSSITQQANKIGLLVEGSGANAHINPANIVAAINNNTSSILISADQINLDGNTIAGYLEGVDVNVLHLVGDTVMGTHVRGYEFEVVNPNTQALTNVTDVLLNALVGASVSGNTLTITKANGSTVTFSKATTLSGAWSSGKLTVTASPQGTIYERLLGQGTASWSGTTVSIPINAQWGSSGQYSESTGWSASVNVNNKLQSKTYTSNGTRYPDSGYIGFSSVTVNVPSYSKSANIKCTGKTTSGGLTTYTFEYSTTNSSQFSSGTTYNMHYN